MEESAEPNICALRHLNYSKKKKQHLKRTPTTSTTTSTTHQPPLKSYSTTETQNGKLVLSTRERGLTVGGHMTSHVSEPPTKATKQVESDTDQPLDQDQDQNTNKTGVSRSSSAYLVKVLLLAITQLPLIHALPLGLTQSRDLAKREDLFHDDPAQFWIDLLVSVLLVLLGGIFAGLTLGLMGQDEVYLQVIKQSGTSKERRAANKVLSLLSRGKHWVLVTLLLSNVVTNETLPIVLDRCLGGGWPAVVSSSAAIVIFGEIIPQSVSVRYGLAVGAWFAPFVLCLMYVLYPLAYPIALLLDRILGEDHGTIYKRAGLKTLVTLHKSMGDVEGLNEDEVTIISAVLDLKEKPVSSIMTPIDDVFVLSSDTILNEETVEQILYTGFNRIPIHQANEPSNFIGMLLVRTLITYDPEDALPISSFPLATLPETSPDSSCLNILNYFQEGKSHMVVVSEQPGESYGAIGVLTLEDVIEELIGEEIVDESDVYVDVHKAIRRAHPSPLARKSNSMTPRGSLTYEGLKTAIGNTSAGQEAAAAAAASSYSHQNNGSGGMSHAGTSHVMSGLSPSASGSSSDFSKLKLGPSNKATNPMIPHTKNVTVKRNLGSSTTGTSSGVFNDAKNSSRGYEDSAPLIDTSSVVPGRDDNVVMNMKGSVHKTENGAIRASLDPENINPTGDLAFEQKQHKTYVNKPEIHSYKAGSIIESVVNVSGVNKVVIEDENSGLLERDRDQQDQSGSSSKNNSFDSVDEDITAGIRLNRANSKGKSLLRGKTLSDRSKKFFGRKPSGGGSSSRANGSH